MQAALKESPIQLSQLEKDAMAKIIADRAVHNSMFAMLAKQEGKWKILCMTFPK